MSIPILSIIVPVYNEEDVFPLLLERLNKLTTEYPPLKNNTEIIFVNDGSQDGSCDLINRACREYGMFSGIHFSRNFGHQQAVSAGLKYSSGNYVAVIDADLQDPPELIPKMLEKAKTEGVDVVYAVRRNRKEPIFKVALYKVFYRLLSRMSRIKIPEDSGDFSLMSRRVVSEINQMPEYDKFIRGLRAYVGFRQVSLEYERDSRAAGTPKYTMSKLFRLALDGIFSFSEYPLKVAMYIGWCIALLSFVYAVYLVLWRIFSGVGLPGFATLSVAVFFIGGVQLIAIGLLGEYLSRVYNEVKQRPAYIISKIDGPAKRLHTSQADSSDLTDGVIKPQDIV